MITVLAYSYIFLARKANIFTISGLRRDLVGVIIFPIVLNTLSDVQLVAQMQRFLPTWGTYFDFLSTTLEDPAQH